MKLVPWPVQALRQRPSAAEEGVNHFEVPEVTSREIKAGTGKSFLDLFCSVNGTTRSLEIVIFRHLAWRPERFQLQLKRGLSMGAANWAAALRGAAKFKMPAALRPSTRSRPQRTLRLATDWEIRDFLADLTPNNATKNKGGAVGKGSSSYAPYAFFLCRMPLDRGHFGAS